MFFFIDVLMNGSLSHKTPMECLNGQSYSCRWLQCLFFLRLHLDFPPSPFLHPFSNRALYYPLVCITSVRKSTPHYWIRWKSSNQNHFLIRVAPLWINWGSKRKKEKKACSLIAVSLFLTSLFKLKYKLPWDVKFIPPSVDCILDTELLA